jgi:hypothetical protein
VKSADKGKQGRDPAIEISPATTPCMFGER